MANFGRALQRGNLHNWVCKVVMHDNVLLVFLDEGSGRRRRDIAKGAIGDRSARLCRNIISCKRVQTLRNSVRYDEWRRRTAVMLHNGRDDACE